MPSLLKTLNLVARHVVPAPLRAGLSAGALAASLAMLPLGASAQAPAKPDAKKGGEIVSQVCASCHGADGNSATPANPKLAGQHPEYLAKQLSNFKVKAGAKEAERANGVMAGFAANLSDADIRSISLYLSTQKLKPAASKNAATLDLGRKIYRAGIPDKGVPACAGCHSPNGAGIRPSTRGCPANMPNTPRRNWWVSVRAPAKNSAQMSQIAGRMSDAEIKAVSDFVAGLR